MPHSLHVIPYLARAMGGPVYSLAGYAHGLCEAGAAVSLAALSRAADGETVELDTRVELLGAGHTPWLGMFRYCPDFRVTLCRTTADVIHSHGLWTYASIAAAQAAATRGLPHIVTPCGMLQTGALRRSGWKKRLCRLAFQDRILKSARCLHAKSAAEAKGIRDFGLTNPVAVIPNPVPVPQDTDRIDCAPFRQGYQLDDASVTLFLGRVHPVKGLERLIRAWSNVLKKEQRWFLVLAGPDEDGYTARLKRLAAELDCTDRIRFTGALNGADKWAAFKAADLFVLPSDFENFGSAAVEAMAFGIPVITTTGTPWHRLDETGAGWCVPPTAAAVTAALEQAMALDEAARRRMGQAGRKLAAEYQTGRVADALLATYDWLLHDADKPAFVEAGL